MNERRFEINSKVIIEEALVLLAGYQLVIDKKLLFEMATRCSSGRLLAIHYLQYLIEAKTKTANFPKGVVIKSTPRRILNQFIGLNNLLPKSKAEIIWCIIFINNGSARDLEEAVFKCRELKKFEIGDKYFVYHPNFSEKKERQDWHILECLEWSTGDVFHWIKNKNLKEEEILISASEPGAFDESIKKILRSMN